MSKIKRDTSGGLPESKAVKLEELIEYSDGSVVSKTLVQSEKGTVTLFSFDAGQGLSEHSAPFDAIVQVLDGTAEIVIGGEKVVTSAGETVLMPKDIPHSLHAPEPYKMLLTMIRG
jgi:quercetin dioxygenase-like cupin family protein